MPLMNTLCSLGTVYQSLIWLKGLFILAVSSSSSKRTITKINYNKDFEVEENVDRKKCSGIKKRKKKQLKTISSSGKTFQRNLKSCTGAESCDDGDHAELRIETPVKTKRHRRGKIILLVSSTRDWQYHILSYEASY